MDFKDIGLWAKIFVIVGALNWLLVGAINWNLINVIFGSIPMLERLIYIIIGLFGLYMLYELAMKK